MGKRQTKTKPHERTTAVEALACVCTAAEAGELLGVTQERVNQWCLEGQLVAKRPGRDWLIALRSVEEFATEPRKPGPKPQAKQKRRKKT